MNKEQWARTLLQSLGYRQTNANVTAMLAWMNAEGGNWNNSATYNPLNTTQRMSGSHSMNSVGVQAYTSWQQGLQATVKTLRNGYYGSILSALKAGASAQAVANAVVSSPWGTKNISVSGITITGQSAVSTSGVPTATANLSMADMAARYGLAAEVLRQNKQIRDLVKEAVKNGYDQTIFQAKLKNTKWWRTTTDAERKYFFLRASDPATYKQKHDAYLFSMNQLAVTVGLGNQLGKGNKPSAMLERAIQYKMREGWTDDRVKAYFGQSVGMHGGEMFGQAGEAYDQIFSLAYNNGLSFSKDWYTTNIRNVVSGRSTVEALSADIRNKAASKYYSFADQIKAGQNVMDLAQPYISSVANILELPATDVGLNNKWVNKAMTSKVAAGQQPGTQYPIWQFENDLRSDPLWKKTNNARETMFGIAHQVAKDFGVAY